ncbi:MAG: HNH endonuclease, partial [Microthrixaceae bacterium]
FPGCHLGPTACEAHHIVHWRRGGRTDLDNLTLVCSTHHAFVHDDGWIVVPDARGGSPQWQRPDGTPVDPRPGWLHPDEAPHSQDAAPPDRAVPSDRDAPPDRAVPRRALRLVAPPAPSERASGTGPPDDDVRELADLARARALALRSA